MSDKLRQRHSRRRQPSWRTVIAAAVAVAVSTIATLAAVPSALETIRDGADWVREQVDPPPTPSPEERAVDEYIAVVKRATTWERSPTIYEPSVTYFKRHFAALDPERPHRMPPADAQPWMSVPDVVTSGPLVAGRPITVSGNLSGDPSVVAQASRRTVSWAFTLTERGASRIALLCRVPLKVPIDFAHGDRVTVAGIVIGDGAIQRADGRGLSRISYMACSSAAHSMNITLLPRRGT